MKEKKRGRRLAWHALALAALAAVALTGCPHNNLLDPAGGGAGSGGRSGDGVQLIITNFVTSGGGGRSAGWLNQSRTISPEHIDLTVDERIQEYVFVATGTGEGGTWGPKFIDIASGTGVAELPGLDSGRWDITVEAYDVAKLTAADAGQFLDRDQILADETKVTAVVGKKAEALVLAGQASLYLGGSTEQVTLTLAAAKEVEFGDVDVAVYFSTATDVTAIFAAQSGYTVKARLVDPAGGQTVLGGAAKDQPTEVTLFQDATQEQGVARIDTDPGTEYKYPSYDQGQYSEKTVGPTTQNQTKLLSYKPMDQQQAPSPMKIPVGKYVLLVEITAPDGSVLYASDPEFFVEGNRTTKGVLEIKELLGSKPQKPTGLEVYYTEPTLTDALAGYDATFKWGPAAADFAAVGYELEIADITGLYKYDGNTQIDADGTADNAGHAQFGAGDLWTTHLDGTDMGNIRANYVTAVTWTNQTTQQSYPWRGGSLLFGNDTITLRLQPGHVYSARVRASNGSSNNSDWTYLSAVTGGTDMAAEFLSAQKFEKAQDTGIFDLVAVTYELKEVDLYLLKAQRADMKVTGDDTRVTNFLQVYEYKPGESQQLEYAFEGAAVAAQADDYVLVAKNDPQKSIVPSWLGWQDRDTDATFGPFAGQNTKADWKYDGFKSLVLVPIGAGGSSIGIEAHTAGTRII